MTKRWKQFLTVVGLVFITILTLSSQANSQPANEAGPAIEVSMTGSVRGSTAIYSVTLKNLGTAVVQDIFVAASVPDGVVFQSALDTPKGSWFRGFEGKGTSLQSAVWLADRVPANGTLGPFTFVVDKGNAVSLRSRAFVHFRLPSDGTAVSPDIELLQTAAPGTAEGSPFHVTHTSKLGLSCSLCHNAQAADYADPLANITNPVDKTACLRCHGDGQKPFYGDGWATVTIR